MLVLTYPVFGLLAWLVVVEGQTVTVQIQSATPQYSITGHVEDGVNIFYGIPFSKPRTPPNRFALPEEYVHAANSNFNADVQHPECVQSTGDGSEDCLYLDVYVPSTASSSRKTHVMVWIHGGAWMSGSKNDYSGKWWAATTWNDDVDECVVVTVNYRMNILGFFESEGYPKNLGMHDNIMALGWIKNHISNFGGDENLVTIYGESAGGMEVLQLWASPAARGLFHRAIAQAPYVWSYEYGTGGPDESGYTNKLNRIQECMNAAMSQACAGLSGGVGNSQCTYQSPTLEQMKNVSCFGPWYGPMSDGGTLISDTFYGDICAKMDVGNGVPLLIGHNAFSINLWTFLGAASVKQTQMREWVEHFVSPLNNTCVFQELGDRFAESGMMQDPAMPPMFLHGNETLESRKTLYATQGVFFNMVSDAVSRLPNVYQFLYNESAKHASFNLCNNPLGAHTCEVPFVVTNVNEYNVSNGDQNINGGNDMDKVVQGNMRRVWAEFAKNGHPGWGDAEVGTFMEGTVVIKTTGAAFTPSIRKLLYQIMCNHNEIPQPCGYAATQTCGDIKTAYKLNRCCGSPSKPFEYPMRRLSATSDSAMHDSSTPSILHSMDLALQAAKANGGVANADKLAKTMGRLLAKYSVKQE